MNAKHEKMARQLNGSLDRRGFIAGALTTRLVASAKHARAIETSLSDADPVLRRALQPTIAPAVLKRLETAPSLRVGLRRVFNPSLGENEKRYINDHTFVQDDSGTWHLIGITGKEPANPGNEKFLLHATAKDPWGPWNMQKPVMQADPGAGETVVWAPYVIRHNGLYWMFYCGGGENHAQYHINLATSSDLSSWSRNLANPIIVDGYDARDPMVLQVGSQWVFYYCATESASGRNHIVAAATSSDLLHWTGCQIVFRSPQVGTFGGPSESPFVVERDNRYYLFLCTNRPYNNTEVCVSDSPFSWNPDNVVLKFDAHAAEVVNAGNAKWFLSSAGWGQGLGDHPKAAIERRLKAEPPRGEVSLCGHEPRLEQRKTRTSHRIGPAGLVVAAHRAGDRSAPGNGGRLSSRGGDCATASRRLGTPQSFKSGHRPDHRL